MSPQAPTRSTEPNQADGAERGSVGTFRGNTRFPGRRAARINYPVSWPSPLGVGEVGEIAAEPVGVHAVEVA